MDEDEDEFNDLLSEKRHKELTEALKGIAGILDQPKNDGVADAIKQSTSATNGLINAVKSIQAPEVNVQVDNQKVVNLLESICKRIEDSNNNVIATIENKMYVDSFKVVNTGSYGEKTISVIYKPSSQITVKK